MSCGIVGAHKHQRPKDSVSDSVDKPKTWMRHLDDSDDTVG